MILPKSIEMTPVGISRAGIEGGKRRRGRPRKPPENDGERGRKSPSSASPPPSKRKRGAKDGKIVSYSSFGRPRRSTAKCGGGPREELVSDDQRGILQSVCRLTMSTSFPDEVPLNTFDLISFFHIRNHPLLQMTVMKTFRRRHQSERRRLNRRAFRALFATERTRMLRPRTATCWSSILESARRAACTSSAPNVLRFSYLRRVGPNT